MTAELPAALNAPAISGLALSNLDAMALLWLIGLWIGAGYWVENGPFAKRGAQHLMNARRMEWARAMARREMRMLDSNLLMGLQQSTTFFASTSLIALGGVIAMLGQAERLAEVAHTIPWTASVGESAFRLRLFAPAALLAYAFFKFAWAQRLYGYCAVLVGAVPDWDETRADDIFKAAERAGRLNGLAARSFNRGLRSLYFSLGSLAWLLGPIALIIGAGAVAWMIHRREFRSDSRATILG